jgi:hypothetical protein
LAGGHAVREPVTVPVPVTLPHLIGNTTLR